ncbi:hypothetical protein DL764_007906 [Monosporascus ibericus]|uniref:Uncharacterized protein n=1 Tax=Monosporascus ibericus TaxID=155417 RepID=A0A4Q4T128_9PEZI|nr:hypothetical protein DL764_007906 [Monosporascus ibericus]
MGAAAYCNPPATERPASAAHKRNVSKEWRPETLRWPLLSLFAAFNFSIIVTIVGLIAKSSRSNGFASVPSQRAADSEGDGSSIKSSLSLSLGILWTALPSGVMQVLTIYWTSIASAVATRQPYVELRRGRGAAAASSILLDYRCTPSLSRWLRAFRLGHATVGSTALTGLALQYIAAPFAAQLFATQQVTESAVVPVSFSSAYNLSGLPVDFDWRPALGSARASLVYGENRIPWTNDEFAFRPFSVTTPVTDSYYIIANTTAHSAYVSCEIITDYSMSIELQNPGQGMVQVNGTDRGCAFWQRFVVMEGPDIFFQTTSTQACSREAHYSRLVFTAGTYSPSSPFLLSNISVISCATDYQVATGILNVFVLSTSSGAPPPPVVSSFTPLALIDPENRLKAPWFLIEVAMLEPVVFNPSVQWSTSEFGSTVLYLAEKQDPTNRLAPAVLMQAIARVFGGVYAVGTAMAAFSPLEVPETDAGVARTLTTRLFVVEWVAYLILTILLAALVLTGWVACYMQRTQSILTEEPEGLLSMAGLLDGSDLMPLVSQIKQQVDYDGRVRRAGKRRDDVMSRMWVAEAGDHKPTVGTWKVKGKAD